MVNSADDASMYWQFFTEASASHTNQLNLLGLKCPEPLMLLRHELRRVGAGEIIYILASDPSTARDFKAFCDFIGHEYLRSECEAFEGRDIFYFEIQKKTM